MTELIPGEAMLTIQNNYLADNGGELVEDLKLAGYVLEPVGRVQQLEGERDRAFALMAEMDRVINDLRTQVAGLEAERDCRCQVESGEGAWDEAHEYPCPKADDHYANSLEYYQRAMD